MNTQQLKERYAVPEIPKCRVCGGALTVQRTGGGPTIWGCTGMIDDPTGERNWIYAEGRSCADEHYERSRWSDYRQGGDADVIELIDALEAAERERDELRAEQAEHDEQIARMESKFSLAKRALDSKTARCEKAEAELRRRDAAAGEPVAEIKWDGAELTVQNVRGGFSYGVTQVYAAVQPSAVAGTGEPVAYQIHSDLEGWRECTPERYAEVSSRPLVEGTYSGGWLLRKLYTAAQSAVLPPEMETPSAKMTYTRGHADGWNDCRSAMMALGAQQQKVVQLPEPVKWPEVPYRYFSEDQVFSMLESAGVKWEVKK